MSVEGSIEHKNIFPNIIGSFPFGSDQQFFDT